MCTQQIYAHAKNTHAKNIHTLASKEVANRYIYATQMCVCVNEPGGAKIEFVRPAP